MDDSSSWRYTTHLANLPLYYEFEKEHNQEDDEIKGEYLDNFKQIFDLYITDSTCDPSQLASMRPMVRLPRWMSARWASCWNPTVPWPLRMPWRNTPASCGPVRQPGPT